VTVSHLTGTAQLRALLAGEM